MHSVEASANKGNGSVTKNDSINISNGSKYIPFDVSLSLPQVILFNKVNNYSSKPSHKS